MADFFESLGRATPAIMSNIASLKQMKSQEEQDRREAVKFDYLQKKMVAEERDGNSPIPLALLEGTPLAKHPRAYNTLLEHIKSNGVVKKTNTGEEFVTKNDFKDIMGTMKLGTEMGNLWLGELMQDKKAQVIELQGVINSGKVKKPEELEALKQQYKSSVEDLIELTRVTDPDFIKEHVKTQEMAKRALYEQQTKPPEYHTYSADGQDITIRFDPASRTEREVGRSDKKVSMSEADLTGRALQGDEQSRAILDDLEKRRARIAGATATARNEANSKSEDEQFTPEAIEALADRFIMTGELPGMGMGKAATMARTKVLNRYAEKMSEGGKTSGDQVIQQAGYRAGRTALAQLESQKAKILAFATTADKNLGIVEEMSDKVGRTGIPIINKWLVSGKKSIAGDPDVSRLDAAMRTAINEYAKVTSSATGGGVTSDQARKEVEDMLNSAQTIDQVKAVISLLRQEMQNRRIGYDEQIQSLRGTLTGTKQGGEASGGTMQQGGGITREQAMEELRRRGIIK